MVLLSVLLITLRLGDFAFVVPLLDLCVVLHEKVLISRILKKQEKSGAKSFVELELTSEVRRVC